MARVSSVQCYARRTRVSLASSVIRESVRCGAVWPMWWLRSRRCHGRSPRLHCHDGRHPHPSQDVRPLLLAAMRRSARLRLHERLVPVHQCGLCPSPATAVPRRRPFRCASAPAPAPGSLTSSLPTQVCIPQLIIYYTSFSCQCSAFFSHTIYIDCIVPDSLSNN